VPTLLVPVVQHQVIEIQPDLQDPVLYFLPLHQLVAVEVVLFQHHRVLDQLVVQVVVQQEHLQVELRVLVVMEHLVKEITVETVLLLIMVLMAVAAVVDLLQ